MFDFISNHSCNVERVLIGGGAFFDAFVIITTLVLLFVLYRVKKVYIYHYFAVMIGVFIFELFTSPLWNNPHLGQYAYIYQDISWILTFGWSTLILSVVLLVDTLFKKYSDVKRFILYLVGMAILGFLAEAMVVSLGVRTYSPEVANILLGPNLWGAPIEALYYIPVFSALVIGFYKYWATILDKVNVVPQKNNHWVRSLIISIVVVFIFELMVEPMAINSSLPSWSYIYRDISIIMTGIWILVIWLTVKLVDTFFIHYSLKQKFWLYIVIGGAISIILESFYVANGFRAYSETVVNNFIGWNTPLTNLPIEIVFAMPLYVALMIATIHYWESITNKINKPKV